MSKTTIAEGTIEPITEEIITGEAVVENVSVLVMESFPVQVSLIVQGSLPDGCTTIRRAAQTMEGNTIKVGLYTVRSDDAVCAQALAPFEENIPLDVFGYPAGDYTIDVNGVTSTLTIATDNILREEPSLSCPGSIGDKKSYINIEEGYCFLYPVGFSMEYESPGTVIISGPPLDDSLEPLQAKLTIQKEGPAEGRTADEIAEAFLNELGYFQTNITRSDIHLSEEEAVIADGVPARGLHRMLFVVHDEIVYILALAPLDEALDQVRGDVELLWATVIPSWTFVTLSQ